MVELLLANAAYVAYRLFVSAVIVKLLMARLPYYAAVLIMAQLSFAYDTVVFAFYYAATTVPPLLDIAVSNVLYTARVVAAWWLIKQLWACLGNYWAAVFAGAQLTFAVDYFIFGNML